MLSRVAAASTRGALALAKPAALRLPSSAAAARLMSAAPKAAGHDDHHGDDHHDHHDHRGAWDGSGGHP